jgi:hypothetical protein
MSMPTIIVVRPVNLLSFFVLLVGILRDIDLRREMGSNPVDFGSSIIHCILRH